VPHGVTGRMLGDMKAPTARQAAARQAGLAGEPATLRQVHGISVVSLSASTPLSTSTVEADAWVISQSKQAVAVYVADCMPVFAYDPKSRTLGLAHAGWRGTKAGVVPAMLGKMKEQGAAMKDVVAAIGPHVGPCCYVVSPETASQFPAQAVHETPNGLVVDLAEAAVMQFQAAGGDRKQVSVCGTCTASNPDQLFSFRRDKSDSRMMAFAAIP